MLVSVLSDFRTKYDALVVEYNESAKLALARNAAPDTAGFLRSLEGLVQVTRETLGLRLSAQSMARFHSFVMSEKKNMKVQPED